MLNANVSFVSILAVSCVLLGTLGNSKIASGEASEFVTLGQYVSTS